MKIFLMRHAHAENNPHILDMKRPLSKRGIDEAIQASLFLKKHNYQINGVLVSSATRTLETLNYLTEHNSFSNIDISEKLYNANINKVLQLIISYKEEKCNSLLVIGHNPTMHEFIYLFADENSSKHMDVLSSNDKTSRIVILEFNNMTSWKNLNKYQKSGVIEDIFIPKSLYYG